MTAAEAAESMRKAAARLRRWASVLLKASGVGDAILHNMVREADRLESDADKLFPRKWKGY